jgi:hypothetical protein
MCFPLDWFIIPLVGNWRIIVNVRHVYAIRKHKLAKIVEPLALFMLFLSNKRELMQCLIAKASQHVVEEVRGVKGGRWHLLNNAISGFDHSVMMAHGGLRLLGGIN